MSSINESSPNVITKVTPTEVETESQASGGPVKNGWFSARNLIILGVAAIASFVLVGVILYFTLPSSTSSDSPKYEALIGDFSTTEKIPTPSRTKVTPSGFKVTSSEKLTSSEVTSESPTSPEPDDVENNTEGPSKPPQLIFAQALFRHGARAPSARLRPEESIHFPRGKGELTDRGFNHSYLMGLFLKKRYVDSGFLNSDMVPGEMKWFARKMSRLLSTASTVGAAMFRNSAQKYVSVPIVTRKDDYLLNFMLGSGCEVIERYWKKHCPGYLTAKDSKRYTVAAKCLSGGNMPPVFKMFDIRDSDKLINMVRNNVPVPQNVTNNYKALSEEYMKVRHFTNGIGDSSMIQIRFGVLIDTILKDIRKAWKSHLTNNQTLKFKAYSTQDWLMSGILDGFGLHHHLLTNGPQEEPNYNVMILIELWKSSNGKAFVKFLYKPEEVTEEDHVLMDLTKFVPGCEGMNECPRKMFNRCCDSTRVTLKEQEKLCYPGYDDEDDDEEDDDDDDFEDMDER